MSAFMHVHLIALRYFGETVRHGSMRQAAESLHVAASAINRQILKLEDQLECKLFERLPEGVRLTAAGEVLYRHTLSLERPLRLCRTGVAAASRSGEPVRARTGGLGLVVSGTTHRSPLTI